MSRSLTSLRRFRDLPCARNAENPDLNGRDALPPPQPRELFVSLRVCRALRLRPRPRPGRKGALPKAPKTGSRYCPVEKALKSCARILLTGFSFLVGAAFSDSRQLLIRGFFFVEIFLEQFHCFAVAHLFSPGNHRTVRGNFVVLHFLG